MFLSSLSGFVMKFTGEARAPQGSPHPPSTTRRTNSQTCALQLAQGHLQRGATAATEIRCKYKTTQLSIIFPHIISGISTYIYNIYTIYIYIYNIYIYYIHIHATVYVNYMYIYIYFFSRHLPTPNHQSPFTSLLKCYCENPVENTLQAAWNFWWPCIKWHSSHASFSSSEALRLRLWSSSGEQLKNRHPESVMGKSSHTLW